MNELQNTQRFQKLIRPDMSVMELVTLYKGLVSEEAQELNDSVMVGNILKEAADLIVVATGVINALGADVNEVLKAVNESNMSKMCLSPEECEATEREFESQGIYTYTVHLDDCYGVYSLRDQESKSGKFFAKDKLVKAVNYAPVDEDQLAKLAKF